MFPIIISEALDHIFDQNEAEDIKRLSDSDVLVSKEDNVEYQLENMDT